MACWAHSCGPGRTIVRVALLPHIAVCAQGDKHATFKGMPHFMKVVNMYHYTYTAAKVTSTQPRKFHRPVCKVNTCSFRTRFSSSSSAEHPITCLMPPIVPISWRGALLPHASHAHSRTGLGLPHSKEFSPEGKRSSSARRFGPR